MENAQLVGLSRQVALRRELDVIANNLANINTAGFKRESVLFETYLMPIAEDSHGVRRDRHLEYVHDRATLRDVAPGAFEQSGDPLDLAIQGDGWFTVRTPEGERYTRAGAFQVSAAGELVTSDGHPVLGLGGAVQIPADGDVAIAPDGTVSVGGQDVDRLRLVAFDGPGQLTAEGSALFRAEAAPKPAEGARVSQGMIERSNVRGVAEMTRLIEVTRAYTSLSRVLDRADELRTDSVSKLAQVPNA
jgi:flagellar basal-body rod protein FlgF